MKDGIERLRAYSARRKKAKGISVDDIHAFDISPDGGFELRLSDIDGILDRLERLELAVVLARDWVAERPEDRSISAGKLVATLTKVAEEQPAKEAPWPF